MTHAVGERIANPLPVEPAAARGPVLDLDQTNTISALAGWSFFAPLPPFVDELNFFSLVSG